LEALEQTGSVRIILLLSRRGDVTLTDLRDNVGCSISSIYNALPKLKNAGIIQESLEADFPRRRRISLTAKGKRVAEKLADVERILSE